MPSGIFKTMLPLHSPGTPPVFHDLQPYAFDEPLAEVEQGQKADVSTDSQDSNASFLEALDNVGENIGTGELGNIFGIFGENASGSDSPGAADPLESFLAEFDISGEVTAMEVAPQPAGEMPTPLPLSPQEREAEFDAIRIVTRALNGRTDNPQVIAIFEAHQACAEARLRQQKQPGHPLTSAIADVLAAMHARPDLRHGALMDRAVNEIHTRIAELREGVSRAALPQTSAAGDMQLAAAADAQGPSTLPGGAKGHSSRALAQHAAVTRAIFARDTRRLKSRALRSARLLAYLSKTGTRKKVAAFLGISRHQLVGLVGCNLQTIDMRLTASEERNLQRLNGLSSARRMFLFDAASAFYGLALKSPAMSAEGLAELDRVLEAQYQANKASGTAEPQAAWQNKTYSERRVEKRKLRAANVTALFPESAAPVFSEPQKAARVLIRATAKSTVHNIASAVGWDFQPLYDLLGGAPVIPDSAALEPDEQAWLEAFEAGPGPIRDDVLREAKTYLDSLVLARFPRTRPGLRRKKTKA